MTTLPTAVLDIASSEHNEDEHLNDASEDSSLGGDDQGDKSSAMSQIGTHETTPSTASSGIQIATSETKAVRASKVLVYIILTIFAIVAGVLTWFYVRREETNTFETQFRVYSADLLNNANARAKSIFDQLQTLSTSFSSHALDSNLDWPFVRLPHFYRRTEELGRLVAAQAILFLPMVPNSLKQAWEDMMELHQQDIMIDTFGEGVEFPVSFGPKIQSVPQEIFRNTNLSQTPSDFALPVVQYGPNANSSSLINLDVLSHPVIQRAVTDSIQVRHATLSEVTDLNFLLGSTATAAGTSNSPRSIVVQPVFRDFQGPQENVVGFVFAVEPFEQFLKDLPVEVDGFFITVQDTCGNYITFVVEGGKVQFRGNQDLHDSKYDSLGQRAEFAEFTRFDAFDDGKRHCDYSITVYPSEEFEDGYHASQPYLFAAVVVAVFLVTMSVFALYDWMVRRRQSKVLGAAQITTAIVQSLFPKNVGQRILAEAEERAETHNKTPVAEEDDHAFSSDPIAELYTDTTIMFADIVGFTAWSSSREPKQVFTLLETIFRDFDAAAHRRRVFKVETVGDCYVAVSGLPEPNSDHAVVMARFARDCVDRFQVLTHQLELELGPCDLAIRVGLHSGQVTAGVLRGDRSRFQLFGDTMNTASRMESTSKANRIQVSKDTAGILISAGKSHWLRQREDLVEAKGKGVLQTYWLEIRGEGVHSANSGNSAESGEAAPRGRGTTTSVADEIQQPKISVLEQLKLKQERLIRWNAEILGRTLREVCAERGTTTIPHSTELKLCELERIVLTRKEVPIQEVQDSINLRGAKTDTHKSPLHTDFQLDKTVADQLIHYVGSIANTYRSENAFHNFEHASHVAMSVTKLMSRIVTTDSYHKMSDDASSICSDPLIRFACAFSAVIHDVDHEGVPNATLVREKSTLVRAYGPTSPLEQNSFDLAWALLMEDQYKDLRRCIYTTEDEFKRFRELVVTLVMATDVMDKDLGAERKTRWAKAFSQEESAQDQEGSVNRRVTIILEHLIQASDVAHTMQFFSVYKKWNERLFHEVYHSYRRGRSVGGVDPASYWYQSEIEFFSHYVIPLAKKLKECGVFGVSSDEYLNYALKNKTEWESHGKQIVAEFQEAASAKYVVVEEESSLASRSENGLVESYHDEE